ncbi:MAG: hypothetical protein FWF80_02605 [Defluviitaleaceae bacterium]|nr:hypothetical protein [Defluviitaleaceae bacterium]
MKVYSNHTRELEICPNCGSDTTEAVYYSAIRWNDSNYRNIMGERIRVVSTHYRNIKPHMGEVCLVCCKNKESPKRKIGISLFVAGILVVVLGIISVQFVGRTEVRFAHFLPFTGVVLGVCMGIIGVKIMKKYDIASKKEVSADDASFFIVKYFPKDAYKELFLNDRVVMSAAMVKGVNERTT